MIGYRLAMAIVDHMQMICTLLQTDNHLSNLSLNFLQAGCSAGHPTNSVKALKAIMIWWQ